MIRKWLRTPACQGNPPSDMKDKDGIIESISTWIFRMKYKPDREVFTALLNNQGKGRTPKSSIIIKGREQPTLRCLLLPAYRWRGSLTVSSRDIYMNRVRKRTVCYSIKRSVLFWCRRAGLKTLLVSVWKSKTHVDHLLLSIWCCTNRALYQGTKVKADYAIAMKYAGNRMLF